MKCRRLGLFAWRDALLSAGGPSDAESRLVLLVIASFMKRTNPSAWPSQQLIAERSALSLRTVQRRIDECERTGWLLCEVERAGGRVVRTAYFPAAPADVVSGTPSHGVSVTGSAPADGVRLMSSASPIDGVPQSPESLNETLRGAATPPGAGNPSVPELESGAGNGKLARNLVTALTRSKALQAPR